MVFNQEIRFPLFPYLRGVGFVDAGRAFDEVAHLSFADLAVGTGIGFRIQTPIVLLRVDMGVPLDASYGPRRPRWFFSIGQMF
jgi:outer membrane protein insertion porin family